MPLTPPPNSPKTVTRWSPTSLRPSLRQHARVLRKALNYSGLIAATILVVCAMGGQSLGEPGKAAAMELHQSPSLLIFFLVGLVGSGHCIGMCGPFVMGYSKTDNTPWYSHVLYGLGRATTYGLMGVVAGSFGHLLQAVLGLRSTVLILAGGMMVYLALAELKVFPRRLPSIQDWGFYQKTIGRLLGHSHWFRTYPLGVCLGFIPCGLTAIALSLAITQTPLLGGIGMFIFGLGTMPAMVGFGMLIQRLKFPRWQRYTAMVMVLLGILTIWLGTYRLGWGPPPPQAALLSRLHPTSLPLTGNPVEHPDHGGVQDHRKHH